MSKKIPAKTILGITERLSDTGLFRDLTADEIRLCLECSKAEAVMYRKGEYIFSEGDAPEKLTMLMEGMVTLGRHSVDGKREIIAIFDKPGDIFGYEHLFNEDAVYDVFAAAQSETEILRISSGFLKQTCEKKCGFHSRLISNMLHIMADKALEMNEHLEIMSCGSLRERIAKYLLFNCDKNMTVSLGMSRQELADYLNAARPSLSRELMNMQDEGLIEVNGRTITIKTDKLD
jgi:CRP-like cAMP-binding protein